MPLRDLPSLAGVVKLVLTQPPKVKRSGFCLLPSERLRALRGPGTLTLHRLSPVEVRSI